MLSSSPLQVVHALIASLAFVGCTTHYIPNTDVEDTDDNRQIVSFCEQYRKAVEQRDVPGLMRMVSERYYEDGGNADASDDLDYAGLREYATKQFMLSKAIRYEIRYRKVSEGDEAGRVYVDFTYAASYRIPGPDDDYVWRRRVAENRLELEREGDGKYKIVAGL